MIRFFTIIVLILMVSSNSGFSTPGEEKQFDWLIGKWQAVNNKPGRIRTETWNKTTDQSFAGLGAVMQGSDTIFSERMKIKKIEQHWTFIADVPENKQPVHFKITSVSNNGFISENPTHDFPKKIEYDLFNDTLKVKISGDGRKVAFAFVRNR